MRRKKSGWIFAAIALTFSMIGCSSRAYKSSPLTEAKGKTWAAPQYAGEERWQASLDRPHQEEKNQWNRERYKRIYENPFRSVKDHPLSTFSIDVDTASYSNIRRFLNRNQRPPKDAVRIEELINYFSYNYPNPKGEVPFSVNVEIAGCPWNLKHRLVRIGLKAKTVEFSKRPPSNLVFLIDVSGSMAAPNKLPLLKKAFRILLQNLGEKDRVAIVVYAGQEGLVLPSTPCSQKETILSALNNLESGGSTNGGAGIQLAYRVAVENFIPGGINRVILATDGDFNVGITDEGALTRLIEEKAKSGIFLTVLGFGMYNLNDSTMEQLADKGNGNYAYIDTIQEARKVLSEEISSTLITVAKDVKIQVEFNPLQVSAYRLIGYENRILRKEDFNDDKKDAGEIGAGHTVTALYEVVPAWQSSPTTNVEPLKYQSERTLTSAAKSGEMLTIKLRYKEPNSEKSKLISFPITDPGKKWSQATPEFKFAAAVAAFGMLLRDSKFKGNSNFNMVLELAQEGLPYDKYGYRREFLSLVQKAKELSQ